MISYIDNNRPINKNSSNNFNIVSGLVVNSKSNLNKNIQYRSSVNIISKNILKQTQYNLQDKVTEKRGLSENVMLFGVENDMTILSFPPSFIRYF